MPSPRPETQDLFGYVGLYYDELNRCVGTTVKMDDWDRELYLEAMRGVRSVDDVVAVCREIRRCHGTSFRPTAEQVAKMVERIVSSGRPELEPGEARARRIVSASDWERTYRYEESARITDPSRMIEAGPPEPRGRDLFRKRLAEARHATGTGRPSSIQPEGHQERLRSSAAAAALREAQQEDVLGAGMAPSPASPRPTLRDRAREIPLDVEGLEGMVTAGAATKGALAALPPEVREELERLRAKSQEQDAARGIDGGYGGCGPIKPSEQFVEGQKALKRMVKKIRRQT